MTSQLNNLTTNIINQLLEVQTTIAAREGGCPTPQEVNLQVKLINCLDKIRRYAERMDKGEEQPPLQIELSVEKTKKAASEQQRETSPSPSVKPGVKLNEPEYITGDAPPITRKEFEINQRILEGYMQGKSHTTVAFRGTEVNRWWLVYNLFQYCLPVPDRRFITTATAFRKTINMDKVQLLIHDHFRKTNAA